MFMKERVKCFFLWVSWVCLRSMTMVFPGLKVIKLELIIKLKIKHNDWLLVDMCPQAANHCTLFWFYSLAFSIVISLKLYQNRDIARQRFR